MNEALLLFSWFIYFYLHSLLAATSVKFFLTRVCSIKSSRLYRIGYNIFFLAGLIVLLYLQFSVPSALVYKTGLITDCVAFCIALPGFVIMIASIKNYDWKSFTGITKEKAYPLVISGMNRYVRHPLYSGTMLFVSGLFIWQPYYKNLLLWALMWIYLAIGIVYEERKLVKTYGEKYESYQKEVKKMIPFIW